MCKCTWLWKILLSLALLAVFALLTSLWAMFRTLYGDSGVNSYASIMAFAAAVGTLHIQTRELRMQRKELQESQLYWQQQAEGAKELVDVQRDTLKRMQVQADAAFFSAYRVTLSALPDRQQNLGMGMTGSEKEERIRRVLMDLESQYQTTMSRMNKRR